MNRFLSYLGSLLFTAALVVGVSAPLQSVQAADACQFACRVSLGTEATNCNPQMQNGIPTVAYVPCATQCRTTCEAIGMAYDRSLIHASTCSSDRAGVAGACSPCSCIPTTALACTDASSGGARSPYCASQCSTTCSAAAGRLAERRGLGASIACAEGLHGTPQCVAVSQAASVRLCTACVTRCVNDTTGDAQRTPLTCYRQCRPGGNAAFQSACAGVSESEANIAQIAPTTGGGPGGTGSGQTGGSTGGGTVPSAPAPVREGVCNFTCQPQIAPSTTACTTNEECATRCGTVCGRSFTGGTCVTSGPTAPRCGASVGGAPRQCIFECSIGASAQERTCNPQGTDDAAPARVCGGFCEASCRAASIGERVPSTARFCGGSVATCRAPGGTSASGGTSGGTTPGGSSGNGGATPGTGAGGARLTNPLPGVDSVASLVGRLVKGILGIVGSVALLMFIYGGVRWILSAGDPKDISASRNILRNATIGMVLIFFSYSISSVILGLLGEVGGGQTNTSSSSSGTRALATCVEYAVSHGHMGRNEAQDSTTPDWACRQTQPSERTDRTRCITRGCPTQGATVLCCAPAAGSAPDSTPTPSGTPAQTGGTELLSATAGCQVAINSEFHLRATDTTVSSGRVLPSGTRVEVVRTGTSVRSGTRIHFVRLVPPNGSPNEGWTFLTPTQIRDCAIPPR